MEIRKTIFSDESTTFVTPAFLEAGVLVLFQIRLLKETKAIVSLVSGDETYPMQCIRKDAFFDYYGVKIPVKEDFFYTFTIKTPEETIFYGKLGVLAEEEVKKHPFVFLPNFQTPDWAKGSVIYQIFTDRFCNGNPDNDVKDHEYYYIDGQVEKADWNSPVAPCDVLRFYGGDLEGVAQKIDYLKNLGIQAIYFNPLFVSPSNHKYDTQDYDYIDPHFTPILKDGGDVLSPEEADNSHATLYRNRTTNIENLEYANQYFAELVEKLHDAGIRVILDGVFNHSGTFHPWMNKEKLYDHERFSSGAFEKADSLYHDYFIFDEDSTWPDNSNFLMWWQTKTLPKLNYEASPALQKEVIRIAKKWLKPPFSIDGWRLDVAADIGQSESFNHTFHQMLRQAIKEENKDALILAEHYGNPSAWLNGKEWDSVMNYDGFMDPVGYFLTGLEKHSRSYDEFAHGNGKYFFEVMNKCMEAFPRPSLETAMNELSNHDHARFLTRTNRKIGDIKTNPAEDASEGLSYATYREGAIMQFTLPGCPTIYYGDETGVTGWSDPDNRRPFPWGQENWDLIYFHKELIRIHEEYACLKTGSYYPLLADTGLVVYGRFSMDSAVIVIINHDEKERSIQVPVWELGDFKNGILARLMETSEVGYNIGKKEIPYKDGIAEMTVPAWSGNIYEVK